MYRLPELATTRLVAPAAGRLIRSGLLTVPESLAGKAGTRAAAASRPTQVPRPVGSGDQHLERQSRDLG